MFIHASTSPNQQIIASLDVARRQMELEGYELVMQAIELALEIRRAVAHASAHLEVLPRARRRRDMIPAEFRHPGFKSYTRRRQQPGRRR